MTAARELAYLSIEELAGNIQRKDVSPVEVTQAMLDRVEQLEPQLHAFNTVFRDEVMEAARAAEAEIQRGTYRGPLHGVPIGIKDIYECGPTTCGSQSLEQYVADKDCTSVAKLKEAGALILGKTATYEFAYGFPTKQSYYQPTHNPWNLAHDAGGSSSGTAASTAAGHGLCRYGLVYGRLYSLAGPVLWHCRTQSNLRACQSSGGVSALVEPRPYRPADSDRDRCGPHAARLCRL